MVAAGAHSAPLQNRELALATSQATPFAFMRVGRKMGAEK
jgi:hypothetical protein